MIPKSSRLSAAASSGMVDTAMAGLVGAGQEGEAVEQQVNEQGEQSLFHGSGNDQATHRFSCVSDMSDTEKMILHR